MAAPQSVSVSVNIPSGSSAADYYVCHGMDGEYKLTKAYFVPSVTLAAHATNTMIFTLGQGTAGSHTDISSAMTSDSDEATGAAYTLGTAREFTLSENASRVFGPTDYLYIEGTIGGSGGTLAGMVVCQFEQYRA